jgi:hypothetical protein
MQIKDFPLWSIFSQYKVKEPIQEEQLISLDWQVVILVVFGAM